MEERQPPVIPAAIGACSRCRTRKVKCDSNVPQCAGCKKHNTSCDISDYVMYSYETVQKLQDRIARLELKLRQIHQQPSRTQSAHTVERLSVLQSIAGPVDIDSSTANQGLHAPEHPSQESTTVEALAEEVGSLALGPMQQFSQQYIGSAAGSSFTRIFFNQLKLGSEESLFLDHLGSNVRRTDPFASQASLPPRPIGIFLLSTYITRFHMWRPIFNLKELRSWFRQAYVSPRSLDAFSKFTIFMVLAIGSSEAEGCDGYKRLLDVFTPGEYLMTALKFYDEISAYSNLQCLQSTLMLGIWSTRVSTFAHNTHLWQLSRFTMSLAIELGCHRNNPKWQFSLSERELRNRLWWSAYDLERTIAVSTGRVLSIRNHAIDAPFPKINDDDFLTESEKTMSPTFAAKGFLPAIHLFRLRNISGDILECIYIARPRTGKHPSVQDTTIVADGIRERLARWHSILEDCAVPGSRESLEMRLELCLAIILLNRPSPSFPNPTNSAMEACVEASQTAIETWNILIQSNDLGVSWRTFHETFVTGLAWLYCSWKMAIFEAELVQRYASICIKALEHVDQETKGSRKYIQFFERIKTITIRRCQSQSIAANIQHAEYDTDLDALGFDWMDGFFNEFFAGAGESFPIDFSIDEDVFRIPENLETMDLR